MPPIDIKGLNNPRPDHCEICKGKSLRSFGKKDFGHAGNDYFAGKRTFNDYDVSIPYIECLNCGFIFTHFFDHWSPTNFIQHIYNEEYQLADPPFLMERPLKNAEMILHLLHHIPHLSTIIDIGGGDGQFSHVLRNHGVDSYSYDPHFGEVDTFPTEKKFDVITSFEVIEHVPHCQQKRWMEQLANFMHPEKTSMAIVSTEIKDASHDITWWYVCPRNGHISIHTLKSLTYLATSYGLNVLQLPNSLFLLCKPKWMQKIINLALHKVIKLDAASKLYAID
ncbi:class I SAM-dependent methyltransferase [Chromobacterium vaccinii]|uniref:class I SAM-dependent methyltransferase n=1 Tax=Chromobacterium vaccinii TaxID=1108595 RepID=UPI0031DB0B86